ncbi:MAG: transketolase [Acidobacteria bacterium]|nr:transketolase [Acidobacteriota bacterium]
MSPAADPLDKLCIDTVRCLAMDAVQQANSGHPGTPMAQAPAAFVLWTRFLKHNPANPVWWDRDRFVLSCGHASTLLYSLLHLSGYELSLEDIRNFRQWGSRTPGHPEFGHTAGVETTTGPLGQGLGNAVGMAIAERWLAARFNRPGHAVVDHRTFAFAGDGDLMEGVAQEAASLAGHLGLEKLVALYDDNRITIEGATDLAFSEEVPRRFEALGWRVLHADGEDLAGLERAFREACAPCGKPTLIVCRTVIGYPAPHKQGSHEAHGAPLGEAEIRATKEILGWDPEQRFFVPPAALEAWRGCRARGAERERDWQKTFQAYRQAFPEPAAELESFMEGRSAPGWEEALPAFTPADGKLATREASGKALNAVAPLLPNLLGGSADLAPSNNTLLKGGGDFSRHEAGRNFHWGIREHAMGACLNGMALHGGLRPFGATFLIFSDYMRPSIRLAALMGLPVVYVFTHDSIGVGEDGPTHQPVEQVMSLRLIPNLRVLRPADATETVEAWRLALERRDGPTVLALTRQKLPVLDRAALGPAAGLARGGYVLADAPDPKLVLVASGSEGHLALAAKARLDAEGLPARVVSMPSLELFLSQPQVYRDAVLPPAVKARLAVEAGVSLGWERVTGDHGAVVGLDRFGASAPAETLFEKFGFSAEHIAARARALVP